VQGDRQAPEGFYTITPSLMNPNSKFYLSFNLGYPNSYDRSYGRTGDFVMVHGKCRSAGCYAMTDALMEEIYGLTRESLKAGHPSFEVHAMPFRMTDERMASLKTHKWYPFWKTLKQGYDPGRLDPAGYCPPFRRPVIADFTPLPEPTLTTIADGTKYKGLVSADVDPTLADINAVRANQPTGATSLPQSTAAQGATVTPAP
jgi:hypothetical protein